MKNFELSENCFGPDVSVNGESLFTHEYDNRDPKMVSTLKSQVLDVLKENQERISLSDWRIILEIISTTDDRYEYDVDNSREYKSCDQCGNWNHTYIYLKKEDETKS
jgi:hypothetical protein